MCNINVIFSRKKEDSKIPAEYMNVASWNSWRTNDDGEGYIGFRGDKFMVNKSLNKLRYSKDYWFLSTHQRYTTSGKGFDNTHPHSTEHLILQHNGVFGCLTEEGKSDSRIYTEKLEEAYVKNKGDIIKAIQEVSKELTGTYSIIVYVKPTGKVYYYKENMTDMYCLKTKRWVVMSTTKENLEYAQFMLRTNKKIKTIRPYMIIDILDNFNVVGKFEEKKSYVVYNESDPQTKIMTVDKTIREFRGWKGKDRDYYYSGIQDGFDKSRWEGMRDYIF